MRGLTAERDSPITTASSLLYDRIQLLSTGLNGQQPNMDMISALLAIAPQTITIGEQYQQSYSRVHNYPSDCYPYEISSPCFCNGLTSFIHQSIQLLHNSLITYFDKTTAGIMHNYFHRLSGLLSHMLAHLLGPNGYHYHFLMRNIDSVTLRVVPTATKTSTDRNSKKKSTISENNNNVSDAESMRFFLLQLVYLSNNLYGK